MTTLFHPAPLAAPSGGLLARQVLRDDDYPGSSRFVQVPMGQLKIGTRTDQLQALLGSCIGIGYIWKKGGRCGLAHCLLPEAPEPCGALDARYVSEAVPALLRLMGACEADYPDIEVILAGGATMLHACSRRLQIGQQNAAAAQKYLSQLGLQVCYCRLGGKRGRTMTIDCAGSSFHVSEIVQHSEEACHDHA